MGSGSVPVTPLGAGEGLVDGGGGVGAGSVVAEKARLAGIVNASSVVTSISLRDSCLNISVSPLQRVVRCAETRDQGQPFPRSKPACCANDTTPLGVPLSI